MLLKTQNSKVKVIIFFTLLILVLTITYIGCDNRSTKVITVIMVNRIELAEEVTITIGHQRPLIITIIPENATNKEVLWDSSDREIADVTEDGILSAVSIGEATITVTSKEGGRYNTCKVIVIEEVPVSGITLNKYSISLSIGDSESLDATIEPSNATNQNVSWCSSDENIAQISTEGIVTAVSMGMATITFIAEDGGFTAECSVVVNYPFIVSCTEEWQETLLFISNNGNDKHYNINIIEDFHVGVFPETTFGNVQGVSVEINGEHTINYITLRIQAFQQVSINGLTLDNNNYGRSLIRVSGEEAIFVMNGNSSLKKGSGVEINGNGTFYMNGGTISGNSTISGAGVKIYWGTFIMTDGLITENTATRATPHQSDGGGVFVSRNGTFIMSGGEIRGNSALWGGGGGVAVQGTFLMSAGVISGNNASHTHGVLIGGYNTLDGSVISSNNAYSEHGVIIGGQNYLSRTITFIMSGGIIYGTTATGTDPEYANGEGLTSFYRITENSVDYVIQYGDGTDILPHIDGNPNGTRYTIIGHQ